MGSYRKYALPSLVVFLLILIASFRVFLFPYVIEPIVLLVWAIWRVIASVDQMIYWVLLIVISAILVFRIIPSVTETSRNPVYNGRKKSLNRVEYWQKLIREAPLGQGERKRLRDSLDELLIKVAAQEEQSGITEIKESISNGKAPLYYVRQRILFFGPGWFRNWVSKFLPQDYILIDETLHWMEMKLEINDDDEPGNTSDN